MNAFAESRILYCAIAAWLLFAQASSAQSTVTVRDVELRGNLGVPAIELQEHVEFLKGHPTEESKLLNQSAAAITGDLRRHGFWKANVAPAILPSNDSAHANKNVVLQITIRAGSQYRLKDVTFSGLTADFPPVI